jgi:hypothetical protein
MFGPWFAGQATENESDKYYSSTYAQAKNKFKMYATALGDAAKLTAINLDSRGGEGELLSIDICWLGSTTPKKVFLHSSGVHGPEGTKDLLHKCNSYVTP